MPKQEIEQATPAFTGRYTTADGNVIEVAAWRGTKAGYGNEFGRAEVVINEIQKIVITNNDDLDNLSRLLRQAENVAISVTH